MNKYFLPIVLALITAQAFAGNGIDPKTIIYKEWADAKPKTMIIVPKQRTVTPQFQLIGAWTGAFQWPASEAMTQLGTELYRRNNFEVNSGAPHVIVREVYLGEPEGLLKFLRPVSRNPQWLSVDDVKDVPFGAKKVLYLSTHKRLTAPQGIETIVIAFDDVSDDDLRWVAYEEVVLRQLRYRED